LAGASSLPGGSAFGSACFSPSQRASGRNRKLTLAELRRPIVFLMLFSGVMALLSGSLGAVLVATGTLPVPNGWAEVIPPDKHVAFSADAWAHGASYASGALGGLFVIGRTAWLRFRTATAPA